ncbi:MAG TPA: glyoxalase [Rheinheimera sp.]|nr:glyoxalase [Rheinheimera sp.]
MHFGYSIFYLQDVPATLAFFQQAFALEVAFVHESGMYGELATGQTKLAFAALELSQLNFAGGATASSLDAPPQASEIGLVTEDVAKAYQTALAAGASALAEPKVKPWGQTVAFLRTPQGLLVELCSPLG